MKKLFTLIFSFVVGVGNLFASDTQVDGIYYDFDDTTMTASITLKGSKYDSYSDEYTGNITIPASVNYNGKTYSVTSIGKWAFAGCRSLTSITFQGAIAQWKKIELGNGWNDDISAKVVHCTDGDVEI